MKEKLSKIRAEALEQLNAPDANLEQIKIKYLGKKGELTAVLRGMGALSAEERPLIGQLANEVRESIENAIAEKLREQQAKALEAQLKAEKLDVTMPGKPAPVGHVHPLTQVQRELENIFIGMGFSIVEGPEVELDYYNFQALNIPDTQDTFYIADNVLLRSHLPGSGTHHGAPKASDPHHFSRPCIPFRRTGCNALPALPSAGGACGGQRHYHGRLEGIS